MEPGSEPLNLTTCPIGTRFYAVMAPDGVNGVPAECEVAARETDWGLCRIYVEGDVPYTLTVAVNWLGRMRMRLDHLAGRIAYWKSRLPGSRSTARPPQEER